MDPDHWLDQFLQLLNIVRCYKPSRRRSVTGFNLPAICTTFISILYVLNHHLGGQPLCKGIGKIKPHNQQQICVKRFKIMLKFLVNMNPMFCIIFFQKGQYSVQKISCILLMYLATYSNKPNMDCNFFILDVVFLAHWRYSCLFLTDCKVKFL